MSPKEQIIIIQSRQNYLVQITIIYHIQNKAISYDDRLSKFLNQCSFHLSFGKIEIDSISLEIFVLLKKFRFSNPNQNLLTSLTQLLLLFSSWKSDQEFIIPSELERYQRFYIQSSFSYQSIITIKPILKVKLNFQHDTQRLFQFTVQIESQSNKNLPDFKKSTKYLPCYKSCLSNFLFLLQMLISVQHYQKLTIFSFKHYLWVIFDQLDSDSLLFFVRAMDFCLHFLYLLFRQLDLYVKKLNLLITTSNTREVATKRNKLIVGYFDTCLFLNLFCSHSTKVSALIQHSRRSLKHSLLYGNSVLLNEKNFAIDNHQHCDCPTSQKYKTRQWKAVFFGDSTQANETYFSSSKHLDTQQLYFFDLDTFLCIVKFIDVVIKLFALLDFANNIFGDMWHSKNGNFPNLCCYFESVFNHIYTNKTRRFYYNRQLNSIMQKQADNSQYLQILRNR